VASKISDTPRSSVRAVSGAAAPKKRWNVDGRAIVTTASIIIVA
jgi:hypothetical protein